mmetsp:Transcript_51102/g.164024  ORF Transcript_51102/g.164024 Transcript_51102/m.164024 type:complete len:309 (+) Transcript_51102:117-1043(+)
MSGIPAVGGLRSVLHTAGLPASPGFEAFAAGRGPRPSAPPKPPTPPPPPARRGGERKEADTAGWQQSASVAWLEAGVRGKEYDDAAWGHGSSLGNIEGYQSQGRTSKIANKMCSPDVGEWSSYDLKHMPMVDIASTTDTLPEHSGQPAQFSAGEVWGIRGDAGANGNIAGNEVQRMQLFSKTRLCRFYEMGRCRKGTSCPFAHGDLDVRDIPNLYKTMICERWARRLCPFSNVECRFAHGVEDLRAMGPAAEAAAALARSGAGATAGYWPPRSSPPRSLWAPPTYFDGDLLELGGMAVPYGGGQLMKF